MTLMKQVRDKEIESGIAVRKGMWTEDIYCSVICDENG